MGRIILIDRPLCCGLLPGFVVMNTTDIYSPEGPSSLSAWQRAMIRLGREMGIDTSSRLALARVAARGVDVNKVEALCRMGLEEADLNWIISTRTLDRRKQKRERLTPEETGRLLRAAKILCVALEVFSDSDRALRWLRKTNPNFDGLSALELIQTEEGAALILDTLNQIDAGFAA